MTHVIRNDTPQTPAAAATQNIDAHGLWQIFNVRKTGGANSPPEGIQLDPALLERLASRYNSPSIGRETARTMPDGEQRIYREAIWVDPFKQ